MLNMNEIIKVFIVLAILLFTLSPIATALKQGYEKEQLFQLGSADRDYSYKGSLITCYLGQLFPGQPIYWCMYPDGSMDHSWFVYQSKEMNNYYTAGSTTTFTFTVK